MNKTNTTKSITLRDLALSFSPFFCHFCSFKTTKNQSILSLLEKKTLYFSYTHTPDYNIVSIIRAVPGL